MDLFQTDRIICLKRSLIRDGDRNVQLTFSTDTKWLLYVILNEVKNLMHITLYRHSGESRNPHNNNDISGFPLASVSENVANMQNLIIPAKAGIQYLPQYQQLLWIPTFVGMMNPETI